MINETLIYEPQELINRIKLLTTILQALGGILIFYIIFNIINTIINRKKKKEMELINKNLRDIKMLLSRGR